MIQGVAARETVPLISLQSPPLRAEEVECVVSSDYNIRQGPLLDAQEALWKEKAEKQNARGGQLFNGTKFRLHRSEVIKGTGIVKGTAGGEGTTHHRKLVLELGMTSYKELVSTNMRLPEDIHRAVESVAPAKEGTEMGRGSFPSYESAAPYLGQAFGNEALLLTKDEHVVLARRSSHVGEYSGVLCGPGGHPEPHHVGLPEFADGNANTRESLVNELKSLSTKDILGELFESPLDEIVEEIGLSKSSLHCEGLYGIVGSRSFMKPCALFLVRCEHTRREIEEIFRLHRNKDETEGRLVVLSFQEAADIVCGKQPQLRFTPCAATALSYLVTAVVPHYGVRDLCAALKRRPLPMSMGLADGQHRENEGEGLRVDLRKEYNRTPSVLDEQIAAIWTAKKAKSKFLFNGTKFRLHNIVISESTNTCLLQLGVTDYKDYVGTNLLNVEEWCRGGLSDFEANRKHMSQALGIEALLVTKDDDAVLFQRSQHVTDYPGFYCCPGGHPEPSNVVTVTDGTTESHAELADRLQAKGEKNIIAELVDSALQEVVDEIGIPRDKLQMLGLFGIVENRVTHGKPDLIFQISTSLTTGEVVDIHSKGQATEAFESEGALFLYPMKELRRGVLPSVPLTPPTIACLKSVECVQEGTTCHL